MLSYLLSYYVSCLIGIRFVKQFLLEPNIPLPVCTGRCKCPNSNILYVSITGWYECNKCVINCKITLERLYVLLGKMSRAIVHLVLCRFENRFLEKNEIILVIIWMKCDVLLRIINLQIYMMLTFLEWVRACGKQTYLTLGSENSEFAKLEVEAQFFIYIPKICNL